MFGKSSNSTSSDTQPGQPAGRDVTGRKVASEPPAAYTEFCLPETHCLTPSGSAPRTGTPAPLR